MRIARHTLYNLLGLGLPLLLALVSIPALLSLLGDERFGWLTLIWAVSSYFGLFDLGMSRALTQQLAPALAEGRVVDAGHVAGTALRLMGALGVAGGLLLVALAPWIVAAMPATTEVPAATAALRWMGLALPFMVLTAGLRGMLEAGHAFAALNVVRLPMGLWTFAGPWIAIRAFGPDLGAIAAVLAFGRLLGFLAHWELARRALPQLEGLRRWDPHHSRSLLGSGGWLTLSNVVSPLMGYVDRFFIGISLSAAAVAYYATPQEMVTKLWIVPGALTAVLLPAFAASTGQPGADTWHLFDRSLGLLLLVLLPLTLGLAMFAAELLSLWLGPAFAGKSAVLLQLFAGGILINCLAHIALTWLHAMGRFRAPALLHLIELPFFMLLLWILCARLGLVGAAIAWVARMSLDALLLFALCLVRRGQWAWKRWMAIGLAAALPFFASGWSSLSARISLWLLTLVAVTAVAWFWRASLLGRDPVLLTPGTTR